MQSNNYLWFLFLFSSYSLGCDNSASYDHSSSTIEENSIWTEVKKTDDWCVDGKPNTHPVIINYPLVLK